MILNDSLIQNGTVFLTNDSLNLTVNLIAENLTGKLVSNTSFLSDIFPIITLLIGSILTYIFNIFQIRRQENKEIFRYEYTLVWDILDISKEMDAQEKMFKLYDKEKRKPAFRKIKNYKLIMQFMKDVMEKKPVENESLETIKKNLERKI